MVYLDDISDSISQLEKCIQNVSRDEFLCNIIIQDAVLHRLAIIGEASRQMPLEFKRQYADIPWRKMIAMRNVLIHEYPAVDFETIWITLMDDVPELKRKIQELRQEFPGLL